MSRPADLGRKLRIGFLPLAALGIAVYGIDTWLDNVFDFGTWSEQVIARIPSPGGEHLAEIIEQNGGATTSYGYSIRVDGQELAMVYGGTRANGEYGVDVGWRSDQAIEVSFVHARFVRKVPMPGVRLFMKGAVDLP